MSDETQLWADVARPIARRELQYWLAAVCGRLGVPMPTADEQDTFLRQLIGQLDAVTPVLVGPLTPEQHDTELAKLYREAGYSGDIGLRMDLLQRREELASRRRRRSPAEQDTAELAEATERGECLADGETSAPSRHVM